MDKFSDRALSIAESAGGVYINGVDGFVAGADDIHKLIQVLRDAETRLGDRARRLAGLAVEQEACRLLYARASSDDYVTLAPRVYCEAGGVLLARLHKTEAIGFGAIFAADGNVGTFGMSPAMVRTYQSCWRRDEMIVVGDNRRQLSG